MKQHTLTMSSPTRWRGRHARPGAVLRVPQDVPLDVAKRWVRNGIAQPGGEYTPPPGQEFDPDGEVEEPFAELEEQMRSAQQVKIDELMKRSKEALLEIARSRLIDVDPKSNKEEVARRIVETPE